MSIFEKGTIRGSYYKSLTGYIFKIEPANFMYISRSVDDSLHYITVTCKDSLLNLECRCTQQSPHCDEINAFHKALETHILDTCGGYIRDGRYYSTNFTIRSFDISEFSCTRILRFKDGWMFCAYDKSENVIFDIIHETYQAAFEDATAFVKAIQPLLAQTAT